MVSLRRWQQQEDFSRERIEAKKQSKMDKDSGRFVVPENARYRAERASISELPRGVKKGKGKEKEKKKEGKGGDYYG